MRGPYLKFYIIFVFIIIFGLFYIYFPPNRVKADVLSLYATDCSGGFINPENATAAPDVLKFKAVDFNVKNSAVLPRGIQTELHCENFDGEIIENVIPKKVAVKMSWMATYDDKINTGEIIEKNDDALKPEEILESASSSSPESIMNVDGGDPVFEPIVDLEVPSIDGLKNAIPEETQFIEEKKVIEPVPEPSPAQVPEQAQDTIVQPESSPSALIYNFIKVASAEEVASSSEMNTVMSSSSVESILPLTDYGPVNNLEIGSNSTSSTEEVNNTLSLDQATSSITNVELQTSVENEEIPHGLVEVMYSYDGKDIKHLSYVEISDFEDASFDVPLAEDATWKSLNELHIYIKSITTTDKAPIIYVDAIVLNVEYISTSEELHPFPSEDRGDVLGGSADYENYSAFLVERPIITRRLIKLLQEDYISTSSTSALENATSTGNLYKTKYELWVADNNSSSTSKWSFVSDDKEINSDTKVFFRYGRLFWIYGSSTLWSFNPKAQSYDSVSLELDKPTQYVFTNESGDKMVLIVSQPDNIVAFESYIPSDDIENQ